MAAIIVPAAQHGFSCPFTWMSFANRAHDMLPAWNFAIGCWPEAERVAA